MEYKKLRNQIEELFENNGIFEPSDIDWIMVEVLGVQRSMLPLLKEISENQAEKIMDYAKKRAKHIPLGYVLGKAYFYGYEFEVNKSCLIPRQDTEILVEQVISEVKSRKEKVSILDIGTGSGAIAITLAKETSSEVFAVDVSEDALIIARKNAKANDTKVEFILSDLFENIPNLKVDFIVSNPPYIETNVIETLDAEVAENEPILALDGGKDGLVFYKKIVDEARVHLNEGGMIFFEIGYNQAESVYKLLEKDFKNINVVKDYGGNDRVVYAKLR